MTTAVSQDDAVTSTRRFRYKAFISYGHATDRRFARTLQSGLQQFGKPFYRRRAFQVFRDETDLTATPSLWDSIQSALDSSEFFILLASPAAAKSEWVPKEIDRWLEVSGAGLSKLFIVVTHGEIEWDDKTNGFNWERTTALPEALKRRFDHEPLYVDFRWAHDIATLFLRHPLFLDAVATLSAPLHGKSKADMIGEDLKNHRRFKAIVATAFLLLCSALVATGMAFYANHKRLQAEIQRLSAERHGNYESYRVYKLEQQLRDAGLQPE